MKLSVYGRTKVITPVILLTITLTIVRAASAHQPVTLRAEPGDTYLNLFGADWQKAFRQNRITVMRKGQPVVSPDILVQGQILQVTGDTRLTARALQRVRAIAERRVALQSALSAIAARGGAAGPKAVALRNILDDDLRYAAELDFLEREADRLTSEPPPTPAPHPILWICVASGALLACVILSGLILGRRRSHGPTGDQRMRAALRAVRPYA